MKKKTRSDEEPINDENAEEKDDCRQNSEGETEGGHSSTTDCDQDSEVSFVGDTDEDIDTTEIEEENWIEHMKRSTRLKDEASQYPMLDRDTLKDEMEIGNEDHFTPRDKMDKKSSKMESRSQHWMQSKQSTGKTEKEMGRRH